MQKVLTSPPKISPAFLDGSPSGPTIEQLSYLTESCPVCGYAAYNLEQETTISREFFNSGVYRQLLDPRVAESGSKYGRIALISMSRKNYPAALRETMCGAWCLDLQYDWEIATLFRKMAIRIIRESGQMEALPREKQICFIDTMRRAGEFDALQKLAGKLMETADPAYLTMLKFEMELASYGIDLPKTPADLDDFANNQAQSEDDPEYYTISGKTYPTNLNGHGNGWHWNAEIRTLTLISYHGGAISVSGVVTIIIIGEAFIHTEHTAGISVYHGNLYILGQGKDTPLYINSEDAGIVVEGKLIFELMSLRLHTKKSGISADGDVIFSCSGLLGHSDDILIRSFNGGLYLVHGSMNATGEKGGVDVNNSSFIHAGVIKLESPRGTSFLIRHGSSTISTGMQTLIGQDYGLCLQDGNLYCDPASKIETSGNIGAYVNGDIHLRAAFTSTGTEVGVAAEGNIMIDTPVTINSSGDIGIKTGGDFGIKYSQVLVNGRTSGIYVAGKLILFETRLHVTTEVGVGISAEMGISSESSYIIASGSEIGLYSGDDMTSLKGGSIEVSGDTAMKIMGALTTELIGISAHGLGIGIEVGETLSMTRGLIFCAGDREIGLHVKGNLILNGGNFEMSGANYGILVEGSFTINVGHVIATGKTGCSVFNGMTIIIGSVNISGNDIGLHVAGGMFTINGANGVHLSGDVGVFLSEGFALHHGILHVSGQFCGMFLENGDAEFSAHSEITGDEYGVLLKQGSVKIYSGELDITSGMCALCLDAGNLEIVKPLSFNLSGKKYGVLADSGNIILNGQLESFGGLCAVSSGILTVQERGNLIATSDKKGGVALLTSKIITERDVVVLCGVDSKSAEENTYDHESYLQVYSKHHFHLAVAMNTENPNIIDEWMRNSLVFSGITHEMISDLTQLSREVFETLVRNSGPTKSGEVNFIMYSEDPIKLVISDTGAPTNPLQAAGFHSHHVADRITYERIENKNILTIYKGRYNW